MTTKSVAAHTAAAAETQRSAAGWTRWVIPAAAVWSLAYGVVALWWTLTGDGFPLGTNDGDDLSMLSGLSPEAGAPLFAAIALAGAGVAALMARAPWPAQKSMPWLRHVAIGFGGLLAFLLVAIVPDTRILAFVGYLPMLIFRAPFDADLRDRLVGALDVIYLHHAAVIAGGLVWALATLVFARRTAGVCERCGRDEARVARWTSPAAAARWGRPVTYVAAAIPALYALTRFAWGLGINLGISRDFLAAGAADGAWVAGAWLGGFAVVGTLLTVGLVQRWGEVFPRWVPWLGGRGVPIALAVVPASIVAVLVFNGGLSLYNAAWSDGALRISADEWGAVGPGLLWPLWGIALGLAALAYYLRRRGACARCGRG